MGRAVTHSLRLLCLTDNEDLTSKEVAFSLETGVHTQLKNPIHNSFHREQMFWSHTALVPPIAILCTDKSISHVWY